MCYTKYQETHKHVGRQPKFHWCHIHSKYKWRATKGVMEVLPTVRFIWFTSTTSISYIYFYIIFLYIIFIFICYNNIIWRHLFYFYNYEKNRKSSQDCIFGCRWNDLCMSLYYTITLLSWNRLHCVVRNFLHSFLIEWKMGIRGQSRIVFMII